MPVIKYSVVRVLLSIAAPRNIAAMKTPQRSVAMWRQPEPGQYLDVRLSGSHKYSALSSMSKGRIKAVNKPIVFQDTLAVLLPIPKSLSCSGPHATVVPLWWCHFLLECNFI